jgi:hypothetical protein
MLPHELTFLVALAVTFAVSAVVVAVMWRPLLGVLTDLYGTQKQAGFWATYSAVFMVLAPAAAVMIGRSETPTSGSSFFLVIDQAKWGVLGLLGAMLIVALGVATFAQHSTGRVYVSPDQMSDLERLLAKVDVIRARNILRTSERVEPGA